MDGRADEIPVVEFVINFHSFSGIFPVLSRIYEQMCIEGDNTNF